MRSKNPIIPGCLVMSRENFDTRLKFASQVGNSIHLDLIDNDFVKGHTLPINEWPKLDLEYVEAHLMVRSPLKYFADLKKAGVTRAIIHIESEFDTDELISTARSLDLLVGFAINPDTNLNNMKKYFVAGNYVQIMGAFPGKTGQDLMPQTISAITFFRSLPNRLLISVDIGVRHETIISLKQAGANYLVASSALYDHGDWVDNYRALDQLVREYDNKRA